MAKFPNSLLAYMPSGSSAFFGGIMNLEELYNTIGDNIHYYRTNHIKYGYLSEERLSRLSGVNLNLIRNIEKKKKNLVLNIGVINNLANALEIPIYKCFIKRK